MIVIVIFIVCVHAFILLKIDFLWQLLFTGMWL